MRCRLVDAIVWPIPRDSLPVHFQIARGPRKQNGTGSSIKPAPFAALLAGFVAGLFVMFHHRSSGHFLGSVSVAARFLGALFDVLVLALFFIADSAQVFILWHNDYLLRSIAVYPNRRRNKHAGT